MVEQRLRMVSRVSGWPNLNQFTIGNIGALMKIMRMILSKVSRESLLVRIVCYQIVLMVLLGIVEWHYDISWVLVIMFFFFLASL